MPEKKPGESEQDYVSRAIPILKKEGLSDEQAKGKAYGMYRSQTEKNNEISVYRHQKKVYKYSAKTVKGFESPEPGDLPKEKADLLADVYADYRSKGMSKEESAKRAWGAVKKNEGESIEQKIFDFFANNPNPEDSKVHAFAESNNIEPSQLEEQIYKLISTFVSGGLSVGKVDFPEDQMQKGLKVELEHVNKDSPYAEMIARKISADHLSEMSDYYDKLEIMEKGE